MGRRSSVTKLGEPIQAEVARLVRAGWTIDDIKSQLAQLGADVSRSAMGRHVKRARESLATYTQAQEVSRVWLDRLDSEPNGDVARLLPEMLRALAFTTIENLADGDAADVKPADVMVLAKAVKDLSGATKDSFAIAKARTLARDQARAELLAEQASKLDAMPAAAGVTATTKAAIREALGIA